MVALKTRFKCQVCHAAGGRVRLWRPPAGPRSRSHASPAARQEESPESPVSRRDAAVVFAEHALSPGPHWPPLHAMLGVAVTGTRRWARCTQGRESSSGTDT